MSLLRYVFEKGIQAIFKQHKKRIAYQKESETDGSIHEKKEKEG